MPRPRALAVAVASCAAAALPGSSASAQPASVQAVAQLGRHAAGDARSAVATAGSSPRRAQRLLARSSRRLRYAHTLAALVRVDQAAASAQAAAPLAEDSAEVARNAADLARLRRGRLEGLAVKTLRQAADLQDQTALALACSRFPGSLTQLRHALDTAVDAQDQLLTALTSVSDCEQVSPRRRRASRAALARPRTPGTPWSQRSPRFASRCPPTSTSRPRPTGPRPTASRRPRRRHRTTTTPPIPTSTTPATSRLDDHRWSSTDPDWRNPMLALRTLLLSLVLVVLAAPGAHARPAPQTVVQDDALFLHGTEQEIRAGLEQAREVGIERVRLTAGWSVIAPAGAGEGARG